MEQEDSRKTLGTSSQAGLAAQRGRANFAPISSPPPGAPGSRFNPRLAKNGRAVADVSREPQRAPAAEMAPSFEEWKAQREAASREAAAGPAIGAAVPHTGASLDQEPWGPDAAEGIAAERLGAEQKPERPSAAARARRAIAGMDDAGVAPPEAEAGISR